MKPLLPDGILPSAALRQLNFSSSSAAPVCSIDASGDGQIDLHDALAILKIGTDESVIVENGDVNDDGEADIQDALLLFQKEAGWGV